MEEMILQVRGGFNKVIDIVTNETLDWEIHVVEGEIFQMLLRLGLILLELFLCNAGSGHLSGTVTMENGSVLRHRRESPRKYRSIFEEATPLRAYYLKDRPRGISPWRLSLIEGLSNKKRAALS